VNADVWKGLELRLYLRIWEQCRYGYCNPVFNNQWSQCRFILEVQKIWVCLTRL